MLPLVYFLVKLFLVLAPLAMAADLAPLLDRVEKRYNRAATLEVKFVETYGHKGRAQRQEAGKLYLRKPGRMRWEYAAPAGKLFLSDGKNFYLVSPGSPQAEKMKASEADDMRAPLAFLLGKLHFEKEFQGITSREEGADTWIAAEPRSGNLPYTHVEFLVTPEARIRRVQVTGQDQSILDFAFEQERLNPPLAAKMFEFRE